MLTFVVQIICAVCFACFMATGNLAYMPLIALLFIACDVLGLITGALHGLNVIPPLVFAAISCAICGGFSLEAASIGINLFESLLVCAGLLMHGIAGRNKH